MDRGPSTTHAGRGRRRTRTRLRHSAGLLAVLGGAIVLMACQGGQPQAAVATPPPATVTAGPAVSTPPATPSVPAASSPVAVSSPAASPVAAATITVVLTASPAVPTTPAVAVAPTVSATPAPVAASTAAPSPVACQFVLGFAVMRDLVGASTVGDCLENERQIPGNGNAEQRTTNGLLVLRALDQRMLFVGPTQTWVNRDGTLHTRPNDQRFEWEGDRQLVAALRRGGHIVYFRHGPTDPNQRDTDPSNLANCATQRNLTEAGRQQGRTVGQALRALNIPIGQVLSSEYCRAGEYARLLFDQDAEIEPALVLPDPLTEQQRAENTEALKRMLARPPQAGANMVMVAHSPNIRLAAGVDLPDEGGAAVFRWEEGTPRLVARVRPDEWLTWAQVLKSP
jgi:phosphohistidine phosphatase SixA